MSHRTFILVGLLGAFMLPRPSRLVAEVATPELPQADLRAQLEQASEPVALNRGPIHEAFAEPFALDPEPTILVQRAPPEPIEEVPPDVQPDDSELVWIAGYWGWDPELEDFVWTSGGWRKPPPTQRWLPGYWAETAAGWQWVPGTWVRAAAEEVLYLPEPPVSLETGPTSIATSEEHFWVPGSWIWQQQRYVWRPGYWTIGYDEWAWIPDRYLWTPYGCVFSAGYWDYPLASRGWLFAPYYFPLHRPGYVVSRFSPLVYISPWNVSGSFWVWPGHRHYYFGNYFQFAARNPSFCPWHRFHGHRRGYDPLFVHHGRTYPGGIGAFRSSVHREFDRWTRRPDLRPPSTERDLRRYRDKVGREEFDRGAFAHSWREAIEGGKFGSFRGPDKGQTARFAQAGTRMREFAVQRQQFERKGSHEFTGGDTRVPRSQRWSLPSTQITEQREVRPAATAATRRLDLSGSNAARRPDWAQRSGLRETQARMDRRTADVHRPPSVRMPGTAPGLSGQEPSVGPSSQRSVRTPDLERGPATSRTMPQFGVGVTGPTTRQFLGGSSRTSTPSLGGTPSSASTTPSFDGTTSSPSSTPSIGGTRSSRSTTPNFGAIRSSRSFTPSLGGTGSSRSSTPSLGGTGSSRSSTPSFRGGGSGRISSGSSNSSRGGSPSRGRGR